jgi:hypothetical protein
MRNNRSGSGRSVPLVILLLIFLGLHTLYNWAIPLGEGPDEPGHLAYALFVATEGRLPVQRAAPEASDVPGEGHQPPLAYALAAPAVAWLPDEQRQILLTANPRFLWAGGDEAGAFMRGSQELAPWPPFTLGWHLARAASGLCGALAVLFTFLAARSLQPGGASARLGATFPLLAAALVALNPQLLFTTALVSNDGLLAALGAALLWWCVQGTVDRGQWTGDRGGRGQWWRLVSWGLVAGLLFGLALLTKQSALLLGPALLWAGWRAAGWEWRRALGVTLAWGLTALAVAGWWFLRNLRLYGDLFGLGAFQSEFATQPFAWGDPAAWATALAQLFASFWGRFGWMSLRPPTWSLWLYGALCALAALGLARLAYRRRGTEGGESLRGLSSGLIGAARSPWVAPWLMVGMALAWTLAFAGAAGLVAWQGRMLFPAIGAIGVLLALGIQNANGKMQNTKGSGSAAGAILPFAFCIGLFALALFMPLGVIRPGYPRVALSQSEAQRGLGNGVYARFAASWERGVTLRGWRLEGEPRAGAPLPLTLTWNSLEPVPRPWTVFVHLVGADEEIVAESNRQPRGDELPFPLWTPGDWITDTHTLPLPATLEPGAYELRVGLFRPDKSGERQDVWAEDGSEAGSYAVLGTVIVHDGSPAAGGTFVLLYDGMSELYARRR